MSKSNHTEAQMIGALKQLEAGRKAEDVAREVGVSKHTIYAWKAKRREWRRGRNHTPMFIVSNLDLLATTCNSPKVNPTDLPLV